MNFNDLVGRYQEWLDLREDPELLRLIYGVIYANEYDGNPVWAMILAISGSGKSELLMSLGKSPVIEMVSCLTPASLMSGYNEEESLFHRLNGRILVIKDLSAMSAIKADDRAMIFGFLRDAYDGKSERVTGKGKAISFEGKFGVICGATHDIENRRTMESALGERFIYIRPRMKSHDVLEQILKNSSKMVQLRLDLQDHVEKFMAGFHVDKTKRTLPSEVVMVARQCAIGLVSARSSVSRNSYDKHVDFPVEITESPSRVYGQICLTMLALKELGASPDELLRTAWRIMIDSIPMVRARVLDAIANGKTRAADVCSAVNMSDTYARRVMEDMSYIGILDKTKSGAFTIKMPVIETAFREHPERRY